MISNTKQFVITDIGKTDIGSGLKMHVASRFPNSTAHPEGVRVCSTELLKELGLEVQAGDEVEVSIRIVSRMVTQRVLMHDLKASDYPKASK